MPARLRDALHAAAKATRTPTLGITGTGGAGKSSLTDELVRRFRLDQRRPAADRDRLDRPVAAQVRRRAARRPHPDERDRAPEHLHALARHARGRQRGEPRAARRDRRLQGRGLRPRPRRDLGHRPGRRRDRAARRRLAVRDDARVRRRLAAREDRHARLRRLRRHQQVRPQGRRRRAARRAQAVPAQPRAVQVAAGRDAGVRHDRRRASTTTASPRSTRRSPSALAEQRPQARAGPAGARLPTRHSTGQQQHRPPARASATSPRSPKPSASTTAGRGEQSRIARERQQLRGGARRCSPPAAPGRGRRPTRAALDALIAEREAKLDPRAQKLLDMWPQTRAAYSGDEYVVKIRDKEIRTALTTTTLSGTQDPQGRAAALRGRRRDPALAARTRTCRAASRSPPACSRSSARTRTRRGCSPARATRSAPTGASTCSPTACRPSGCPPRSTR